MELKVATKKTTVKGCWGKKTQKTKKNFSSQVTFQISLNLLLLLKEKLELLHTHTHTPSNRELCQSLQKLNVLNSNTENHQGLLHSKQEQRDRE